MRSSMVINKSLKKVLINVFDIDEKQVTIDLSKENLSKWDSLAQMELLVALEKEFGVNLIFEEIAQMTSVIIIIDILTKKGVYKSN